MSNPPNPLAKFRSYSYQHILAVADDMTTISDMVDDPSTFERPSNNPLVRYNPITVRDGRYVILIDSRTDVKFNLKSIEWETILAPQDSGGVRTANAIESLGSMQVHEPFGVDFLEVLANVTGDLNRAPSALIFILKTIFVGHTYDGNVEVISNARPFTFVVRDIKAVMDAGGASYKVDFVAVTNGAGRIPEISQIANGISLKLNKGITLGAAIDALETRINERYGTYYDMTARDLSPEGAASDAEGRRILSDRFKRVRYKFEVDPVYRSAPYIMGDQASKTETAETDTFVINAAKTASLPSLINKIQDKCGQIGLDSTGNRDDGRTFTTKITSTLSPQSTNGEYVVTYRLNRFEAALQRTGDARIPVPGEFIEFNYIYTGKNVDILDFDIKMDYGLSFFHITSLAKDLPDSQEEAVAAQTRRTTAKNTKASSANPTLGTEKTQPVVKEPLFLGLNVVNPEPQSNVNPSLSTSFDALMQRQAQLENVHVRIKIIGNPQLLSESTPFFGDVINPIDALRVVDENSTGAADWYHIPALAKVNIQYPDDNDLNSVKAFWYRGFYNLHIIKNKFDGGDFTQELEMFSIPADENDISTDSLDSTAPNTEPNREILNAQSAITQTANDTQFGDFDLAPTPLIAEDNVRAPNFSRAELRYKSSVNAIPTDPRVDQVIQRLYPLIVAVWQAETTVVPVITSTIRNTLVAGTTRPSLHNVGRGLDLRGNNLGSGQGPRIRDILKRELRGQGYTIIWETFADSANNHIHIQFDGKNLVLPDDNQPEQDANNQPSIDT